MKPVEWTKHCDKMDEFLKDSDDMCSKLGDDVRKSKKHNNNFTSWDKIGLEIKEFIGTLYNFRDQASKVLTSVPDHFLDPKYLSAQKRIPESIARIDSMTKHAEKLLQEIETQRKVLSQNLLMVEGLSLSQRKVIGQNPPMVEGVSLGLEKKGLVHKADKPVIANKKPQPATAAVAKSNQGKPTKESGVTISPTAIHPEPSQKKNVKGSGIASTFRTILETMTYSFKRGDSKRSGNVEKDTPKGEMEGAKVSPVETVRLQKNVGTAKPAAPTSSRLEKAGSAGPIPIIDKKLPIHGLSKPVEPKIEQSPKNPFGDEPERSPIIPAEMVEAAKRGNEAKQAALKTAKIIKAKMEGAKVSPVEIVRFQKKISPAKPGQKGDTAPTGSRLKEAGGDDLIPIIEEEMPIHGLSKPVEPKIEQSPKNPFGDEPERTPIIPAEMVEAAKRENEAKQAALKTAKIIKAKMEPMDSPKGEMEGAKVSPVETVRLQKNVGPAKPGQEDDTTPMGSRFEDTSDNGPIPIIVEEMPIHKLPKPVKPKIEQSPKNPFGDEPERSPIIPAEMVEAAKRENEAKQATHETVQAEATMEPVSPIGSQQEVAGPAPHEIRESDGAPAILPQPNVVEGAEQSEEPYVPNVAELPKFVEPPVETNIEQSPKNPFGDEPERSPIIPAEMVEAAKRGNEAKQADLEAARIIEKRVEPVSPTESQVEIAGSAPHEIKESDGAPATLPQPNVVEGMEKSMANQIDEMSRTLKSMLGRMDEMEQRQKEIHVEILRSRADFALWETEYKKRAPSAVEKKIGTVSSESPKLQKEGTKPLDPEVQKTTPPHRTKSIDALVARANREVEKISIRKPHGSEPKKTASEHSVIKSFRTFWEAVSYLPKELLKSWGLTKK